MTADRLSTSIAVLAALTACFLLLRPVTATTASPELALTAAEGDARMVNSKQGEAILRAANWRPGRAIAGKVAIRNASAADGVFNLSATRIAETAGIGGGALGEATRLLVRRKRSVLDRFETVYDGSLSGLRRVRVGDWAGGGTRYFDLRATVRARASRANRFQGSRLRFGLRWRVRAP